jgi:hypothetical protein
MVGRGQRSILGTGLREPPAGGRRAEERAREEAVSGEGSYPREPRPMSEKVLVYLGPTLSKEEALGIVPEAIIRPPAKQSVSGRVHKVLTIQGASEDCSDLRFHPRQQLRNRALLNAVSAWKPPWQPPGTFAPAADHPKVRLASSVKNGDSSIPVQLYLEDPIRRVERLLYAVRHHRRHECRKILLGHAETNQQDGIQAWLFPLFVRPNGSATGL